MQLAIGWHSVKVQLSGLGYSYYFLPMYRYDPHQILRKVEGYVAL